MSCRASRHLCVFFSARVVIVIYLAIYLECTISGRFFSAVVVVVRAVGVREYHAAATHSNLVDVEVVRLMLSK